MGVICVLPVEKAMGSSRRNAQAAGPTPSIKGSPVGSSDEPGKGKARCAAKGRSVSGWGADQVLPSGR